MSDNPTPASETAAPTDSGQPASTTQQTETTQQPVQQTQPTGVDPAKYDRLKASVRGMQHLVDPLTQAGIDSAEKVQALLEAQRQVNAFRQRGVNLNSLLQGEQPQTQQPRQEDKPLTRNDLQSFFQEQQQEQAHRSADDAATSVLRQYSQEIGGEYADDVWDIVLAEAGRYLRDNGERYPVGHPLRDRAYVPPGEHDIAAIKEMVSARLARIRGAAARTAVDQSVTSQATPGGNPNTGVEEANINPRQRRVNRINELLGQHLNQLNGESVSQA